MASPLVVCPALAARKCTAASILGDRQSPVDVHNASLNTCSAHRLFRSKEKARRTGLSALFGGGSGSTFESRQTSNE